MKREKFNEYRERSRSHSSSYNSSDEYYNKHHHREDSRSERKSRRNRVSKWSNAPNPTNLNNSNMIPYPNVYPNPYNKMITYPPQQYPPPSNNNFQNNIALYNPQMKPANLPPPLYNPFMFNNSINNALLDQNKIKKKIFIPKKQGINYVGLLIGPKGTNQKRLEQESGCKILVRGKGTQKEGMPELPEDSEEQHVLIIGDSETAVKRATHLVNKILLANEKERNQIKEEQIKKSQEIRTELLIKDGTINKNKNLVIENYYMTPYGPPDKNAKILGVPDDCVGLIIGKNGDTIRRLNRESGCKIQIAIEKIPNSQIRNVFIEGPEDKYEKAKNLIEEIVTEQINMKNTYSHLGETNPFPGPHSPLKIPNKMVGLIIGRNGETVKIIHEVTGCQIFIPKDSKPNEDFRELQLSGKPESVEICKREIISMIHLALYGRLPYNNSLFYPYVDPVTKLPIIDPGIMAQIDPNWKLEGIKTLEVKKIHKEKNKLEMDMFEDNNIQNLINSNINDEKYEEFENEIFLNSKKDVLDYNINDYNNPVNYDLYYQSLYQMYPQLNDYYKKAKNKQELIGNNPLVIINTSVFDTNNTFENRIYDAIIQNQKENQDEKKNKKYKNHLKKN